MITFYGFSFLPASRLVFLALEETKTSYVLKSLQPWNLQKDFLILSPWKEIPVIVKGTDIIRGAIPICEDLFPPRHAQGVAELAFLENADTPSLLGKGGGQTAEIRNLVQLFEANMTHATTLPILQEKALNFFDQKGAPSPQRLTRAEKALQLYLNRIQTLFEAYNFLAGNTLSLADLAAAAHFSILDYFGAVPWENYPLAKQWYMKMKSRPAMQKILSCSLPGFSPPPHYATMDF